MHWLMHEGLMHEGLMHEGLMQQFQFGNACSVCIAYATLPVLGKTHTTDVM